MFLKMKKKRQKIFLKKVHKIWPLPGSKCINKMIELFKKAFGYTLLYILKYIPGTQEVCNKKVRRKPRSLAFISGHLIAQEVCNEAVKDKPCMLLFIPDHLMAQEMCIKTVEESPWVLCHVPDQYETQEMCDDAV